MKELDLTLLTDEERNDLAGLHIAASARHLGAVTNLHAAAGLRAYNALIAARAENKRLREQRNLIEIEAAGLLLMWHRGATYLSGLLARLTDAMRAAHPDYLEWDYDKRRAALLQSEKGGAE